MLFKRKKKIQFHLKIFNFFWPRLGIKRWGIYLWHRLSRISGSPYSIAAGFAFGAAASFTPLLGFHILLACLLAWIMRANYLVAAFGTIVGNPWTFPFIWVFTYNLGNEILGIKADGFFSLLTHKEGAGTELSLEVLIHNIENLFVPMLVGSIPAAIVAWIVSFLTVYFIVINYRCIRASRKMKKERAE